MMNVRFILSRVLCNPDIQSEFAHPTVPHHYGEGYEEALKRSVSQIVFTA